MRLTKFEQSDKIKIRGHVMLVVLAAVLSAGISALVAIAISGLRISHKTGTLEGGVKSADQGIKRLDEKIRDLNIRIDRFLLGIASPLLSQHQIISTVQPDVKEFRKIITEILRHFEAKENPVTIGEIRKLQDYVNKTARLISFTRDEYRSFQFLVQNVSNHLPERQKAEFDLAAIVVLRFAAGLSMAALIK